MSTNVRVPTIDLKDGQAWRNWLEENHLDSSGVMLVFHKGGAPSITYDEALDEALAFGWIDSVIRRIDEKRYVRKFSPRRPGSIWSSLNIERVSRLKREGRMTEWGLDAFAKKTSKISLMEQFNLGKIGVSVEFEAALRKNRRAWANYLKMAPSHRKRYAIWIAGAKKPETRRKRIAEAVTLVETNVKDLLK